MFHCQARVIGSNASSPSSASAVKNWIAKNGFAAGLLLDQLRQWPCALQLAVERVGDEPANIVASEGRQHDLLDSRSRLLRIASSVRRSGWEELTSLSDRPRPAAGAALPGA